MQALGGLIKTRFKEPKLELKSVVYLMFDFCVLFFCDLFFVI